MTNNITQQQLIYLENMIDKAFSRLGIDVEFTSHFLDRVNDSRNGKQITIKELAELFAKEYKRWGRPIANMDDNAEAVLKDLNSDINIPFVINKVGNGLELAAKTVMRKKNFHTPDPEYKVETYNVASVKKMYEHYLLTDAILSPQEEIIKAALEELQAQLNVDSAHKQTIAFHAAEVLRLFNLPRLNPRNFARLFLNWRKTGNLTEGWLENNLLYITENLSEQTNQLNELFDNPYTYSWKSKSDEEWFAGFRTDDGREIDVAFEEFYLRREGKEPSTSWEINFSQLKNTSSNTYGDFDTTGNGDEFKIFATVIAIIKEWYSTIEKTPDNIVFSAGKSESGKTTGRVKLYNKFAKQFARETGMTLQMHNGVNKIEYILTSKNIDESTQINELFDKEHDWSWITKNKNMWVASFANNSENMFNSSIEVQFESTSSSKQTFSIEFTAGESAADRTGDGDEFATFSTVIKIIEDFINTKQPVVNELTFTAHREGEAATSPKIRDSRAELYKKMASRLAHKHNMEFEWKNVARMTAFTIRRKQVDEQDIFIPDAGQTLGVKRADMPQVHKNHYPALIDLLKSKGLALTKRSIHATKLRPVQNEFSVDGVKNMMKQLRKKSGNNYKKPILVSSDNYILDGHHRWLAAYNTDESLPIIQVNLKVNELLELLRDFKHTTYKDIYEKRQ